jgi:NADH:ubiquinone oxidoreductase subunit E
MFENVINEDVIATLTEDELNEILEILEKAGF